MKKLATPLLFLGLCFLLSCSPKVEPANFRIRFGIAGKDKKGFYVLAKEADIIPLKVGEDLGVYGYEITPLDGKPYTSRVIVHLPSPPKVVSGTFSSVNPVISADISSPITEFTGETTFNPFWFDEGDPDGPYSIDILVEEKLIKTIHYQVQKE